MKRITSVKNPLIQELTSLQDRKNRLLKQMFLIEGEHLVLMAASTKKLHLVLIDENCLEKFTPLLNDYHEVEIIIVNDMIIKKLSQNKTPQPIIGVCPIVKPDNYLQATNIIMIDTIQDPGNLGNILRTMSAFNISDLYLSPNSVDLYNHKVISASQGAIFYVNVHYENFTELLVKVKKENYSIYGTFLHQHDSLSLEKIVFSAKNALLFGNEGQGINEQYKSNIDKNFVIPTSSQVESLNLATSIAIVAYCLFVGNILK